MKEIEVWDGFWLPDTIQTTNLEFCFDFWVFTFITDLFENGVQFSKNLIVPGGSEWRGYDRRTRAQYPGRSQVQSYRFASHDLSLYRRWLPLISRAGDKVDAYKERWRIKKIRESFSGISVEGVLCLLADGRAEGFADELAI